MQSELKMMNVADLVPWGKNPRINDHAVKHVAKSIEEFGFASPIVVRKADNMVICGNTRLKAVQQLQMEKVPCHVVDLDERTAERLAVADNKIGGIATFDDVKLGELFADFDDEDFAGLGFSEHEIDNFIDLDTDENDNNVPIIYEDQPISVSGDIWILGNHRLMCGDSLDIDQVSKLMDGDKADLLLTDPPYNVAYVGKTKDALTIQNDSMEDSDFREFLSQVFKNADEFMKQGAAFYIWHADSEGYNFRGACRDVDWQVRQCLIWMKNIFVMGRQDYHWRHEPCLYGWKGGAAHKWCNDRKQDTILEFERPMRSSDHPTMKPVDLFQYQLKNNTDVGDIVLDIFGGSGTTLIACENAGRSARLMELDPAYCDVIVRRWQQKTGLNAETLNGKKMHMKKEFIED